MPLFLALVVVGDFAHLPPLFADGVTTASTIGAVVRRFIAADGGFYFTV